MSIYSASCKEEVARTVPEVTDWLWARARDKLEGRYADYEIVRLFCRLFVRVGLRISTTAISDRADRRQGTPRVQLARSETVERGVESVTRSWSAAGHMY